MSKVRASCNVLERDNLVVSCTEIVTDVKQVFPFKVIVFTYGGVVSSGG